MASRGMGRRLSQGKTGSRACLGPTWDFQEDRNLPTTMRAQAPDPCPGRTMTMRFYTSAHRFYCGVDVQARSMCLCILDAQVVFDKNLPALGPTFLHVRSCPVATG